MTAEPPRSDQDRLGLAHCAQAAGSSPASRHGRQEVEVDDILRALRSYGVLTRARLLDVCGAAHWSDAGGKRALAYAVSTGRVRKLGDDLYEIAEPPIRSDAQGPVRFSDPRHRPASGAHRGPDVRASSLEINPRGPFRLDLTAWALRRRPHNAVDRWAAATYERVVSFDTGVVGLAVTQVAGPDAPRLAIRLSDRGIDQPAAALAHNALNDLLGLNVDLRPFAAMAASDPLLAPLATRLRGLKPPRFPTVFEALVNGVACQQLSLAVGILLLNRLTTAHGKATSDAPDGPRAFPDPDDLASLEPDELMRHGFSFTKARTIIETARAVVADDLDLEALRRFDDETAIERLVSLRGIGRWTAEYVLLRGLGRLHVFPGDDVGAHNKLRRLFGIDTPLDHEAVGRLVAPWHPYAGVAYFHLLLDSLSQDGRVTLTS